MASNKAGAGCLVLFGAPFALVGVFMFGVLVSLTFRRVNVSNWVETPATVLSADLESHTDSDGDTSHTLKARYKYEYQGRSYEGTRVNIGSMASTSDEQQDRYAELEDARKNKRTVTCYVDPDDPREAVLDRSISFKAVLMCLIFGLVFGGAGFGIIGFGVWTAFARNKAKIAREESPKEPWLWRPEWRSGEIRSSSRKSMGFVIVFAAFWNLISFPVLIMIPWQEELTRNKAILVALIFPVIGVIMIGVAIYMVLRWLKYGDSVFEMATFPGVIGGKLEGTIRTRVMLMPKEGFDISLQCLDRYTTGSGKNSHTHEDVMWERAVTVKTDGRGGRRGVGTEIPILFAIPYDCKESSPTDEDHTTIWRITVKADVPGIDFEAKFDVPVFKTGDSVEGFELAEQDAALLAQSTEVMPIAEVMKRARIEYTKDTHGTRFYFPATRYWGSAIGMTIFNMIWLGAVSFMIRFHAPIAFPIIFSLIGIFTTWGMLDAWFGTATIVVGRRDVTASGGLFGIGPRKVIGIAEVEDITTGIRMQSGTKVYYRLKMNLYSGKSVTIGKMILGSEPAERIAEAIWDEMKGESS